MSTRTLSTLSRWARRGAFVALALALALALGAYLADLTWGREVLLIAPHDPAVVELNRSLWSAGEPVADLYGSPMSAPTRVLVRDEAALVRPEEDPGLVLLPVATLAGRPFQSRTLWWAVRLGEAGLGAAVVALLAFGFFLGRRVRLATPASAA